jgi:hypothetical protein
MKPVSKQQTHLEAGQQIYNLCRRTTMSLVGLDVPAMNEAYMCAIAVKRGWLLLRYTSRDSVELLDWGKGGVDEMRNVVLYYEESSPLHGLIVYRRHKVLMRYTPDGISRQLQGMCHSDRISQLD